MHEGTASACVLRYRVFAAPDFKPIAAVNGLDVEDLASGESEHAFYGRCHVFVHTVRKFDHDDGALPRCSDKAADDGTRTFAELAEDNFHRANLALCVATSTGLSGRRTIRRRILPEACPPGERRVFAPSMTSQEANHGEHLTHCWGRADRMGCVEVVCGSMFSGKTEELIRRVKRARLAKQRVLLFKPRIDNRYDDVKVVSHEGIKAEATAVSSSAELLSFVNLAAPPDVVGIDEAQFFDAAIVDTAETLANAGVRVICAGLDQDYRGKPFGPMPALMSIAEYVTKLQAVCSRCGAAACRSQRLLGTEGQLFVGGASDYEPRCRRCFVARVVDAAAGPPSRT